MNDFWHKLDRPFLALAPMADVTDAAFRRVIAKYGRPDVMYTEFVSADGLFLGGYDKLINDLKFTDEERPIVAQFFSSNRDMMEKAGALARELGFDGVDINMGCPDKSVCKQGAGAGLMQTPELARELIRALRSGASGLPVSVKTRIGWNKIETDTWVRQLLEEEPSVLILHARTKKEMSKVPAHWDEIEKAVAIRDEMGVETLIVGNGDAEDLEDARQRAEMSGADGVMLGRAIFGNPWLWSGKERPPLDERLKVLLEHTKLFEELLGHYKSFSVMKKHFKSYIKGKDNASTKELFTQLMEAQDVSGVESAINTFLAKHS